MSEIEVQLKITIQKISFTQGRIRPYCLGYM